MSTVTRCSGIGRQTTGNLLAGPIATLAVAFAFALLQLFEVTQVPGLGVMLLACVVFSVLRGGWRSGVASLLIFVAGCTWLKSHGTWRLAPAEALALAAEVLVTIPITIAIGRLVTRLERAGRLERELRQGSDDARKDAEGAHARLDEILERITDGFFAVDREWRCTYINASAEQLLGCSRADLLQTSIWEALPLLVGSASESLYRHALASGEAVHFEVYYAPLDAELETHAYPSANGLSIYLRDVSARARAERSLRSRVIQQAAIAHIGRRALSGASLQCLLDDAVARLASVFDVELAKVLEHQPDGTLLLRAGVGWKPGLVGSAVIPAATGSQAGYTLLSAAPVIVEDLRSERRFAGPDLLVEHHVVSGMSLVIPGPDRPYGILAVHSTRRRAFTHDDVAFLTGMAQVLALAYEWTRATAQLRESEQRFRQLADNLHEVLFVTDTANREPGYVSPAYETVWGRPVASWYEDPRSWLELVHPEDRPRVEQALPGLADGRLDEQFRIVRQDGTIRWIHERAFGVRDDRGRVQRIVGIAEDVTSARQLAAEQAARAAAEAGAAARDEVLAIVSHDLRSPLATIVMAANALELDGAPKKPTEIIRSTVKQMLRLIRDLLEVSRMERGCELEVVRADIDAGPLVRDVADAFALRAQRRSIALDVQIAEDLPPIFADGERITQALDNLLSNAIKFTPSGGRVSIEAIASADGVRISISDTGRGIRPEDAASLFQRYWQAHPDRRGIGLGLSIVKAIVDAHAGRVWAETRPAGGSRFFVEIPTVPCRATAPANELAS